MDSLSSKTSIKLLKRAHQNLSTDLNVLYDEALLRIGSQNMDDRTLAEKALRWVAFTYRPLDTRALREALAIEPEDMDFDAEAMHRIGLILDVCAGLLIHNKENDTVRLVHYTAQDYFHGKAGTRFDKAHALIASDCLIYLNYECFQQPGAFSDDESVDDSEISNDVYSTKSEEASDCTVDDRDFYLLRYASTFWAQHALTKRDHDLTLQIQQFLDCKPRVRLLRSSYYDDYVSDQTIPLSTLKAHHGCQIAAFFGLNEELEVLCEGKGETQALPCHLNSSLLLATTNGHIRATEIVLDHGADIDNTHISGSTALLVAISYGYVDVVKLLLARGSGTDTENNFSETPLCYAVLHLQADYILALLDHGADIHNKDTYYGMTALHWASHVGDLNIVNILLARGSDPESHNNAGQTPFFLAVQESHIDCAHALLDHGADMNVKGPHGLTPLHHASATNDIRIISELMKQHTAVERSEPMVTLKYNNLGTVYAILGSVIQCDLDEGITLLVYDVVRLNNPWNLRELLQSRESVLELLVWDDGLTALDIAKLREHEEMIRLMEPLNTPTTEPVPVTVKSYLFEQLGVASVEEAEEELSRRISAENQPLEEEADEETENEAEVESGETD